MAAFGIHGILVKKKMAWHLKMQGSPLFFINAKVNLEGGRGSLIKGF